MVWSQEELAGAWGVGERPGGALGRRGRLAGAGFGRAAGVFGPSRSESRGAGGGWRLRPGLEAAPRAGDLAGKPVPASGRRVSGSALQPGAESWE